MTYILIINIYYTSIICQTLQISYITFFKAEFFQSLPYD
jgi:hypothetical protein